MGNDAQTVQERIKQLGGTELMSVKKEIADAHNHIYENETIQAVASGMIDTKTWLLIVTDTRIILLYKGMLGEVQKEEISITHIKGVSVKSGILSADLSIDTGHQIKKLTSVGKTLANKVQDTVSRLLNGQAIPEDIKKAQDTTEKTNNTTSPKKSGCMKFFVVAFILLMIIGGIGTIFDDTETDDTKQIQTAEENNSQVSIEPEMPWTASQIMNSYNEFAAVMQLPAATHTNTGEQVKKTITYQLTPYSSLLLICNKNGKKPTSMMFFGVGDGSQASGAAILLSGIALVSTMTPNLAGEERGNIIKYLGLLDGTIMDGQERTVTTNHVVIKSSFSDVIGVNINIESVQR